MSTTNIIPLSSSAKAHGGFVPSKAFEDFTAPIVLTPEFAEKLRKFNGLTRDIRAADIGIEALAFLDNKIFINLNSAELLRTRFRDEVRGIRYRTEGRTTRNVVTIRGIDVAWYTPVKEQDQ